ncbi:hypothetical protein [Xanthomonas translucens]|nr:hypothetical protein [Xanthomonas translucens]MCT8272038.1 hypothetical protein [Xanthomonas translucens pv. undulosa]WLA05084.1 hypothetical protein MO329_01555 [Xanthomonas translucens]WNJ29643.1 hypothetical protein RMA82_12515 [Xanthomonas translucens pv. undulosa]
MLEIQTTVLTNQITRDAELIAKSFDKLHGEDLKAISKQFAHSFGLLTSGLIKATQEDDDLRIACGELLQNALNSIAAAAYLLRGGFVLQPGPVIRSCMEALAVVLHLIQFQEDLKAHRAHNFDSTRAIASAKTVFPPFGRIYGLLSKEFTHIGQLHKQFTPIREYTKGYEPLDLNLQFVTSAVWMCYVTCELAFLDVVAAPRYWSELPAPSTNQVAYAFNPGPEEKAWMEKFLGIAGAP